MTVSETHPASGLEQPATAAAAPSRADLVDAMASAVRAVPGVADLHAGAFGEVGTYLPGRRVAGISIGAGGAEVHVVLRMGHPVRETAARVRGAVAALTGGPVHVTVEDVVPDHEPDPDPVPGSTATPALRPATPGERGDGA